MKHSRSLLIASMAAAAILTVSTGCVAEGGGGGGEVEYGGGPWIQSDVIVTGGGRGWYGGRDDGHGDGHADRGYVHPSAPRPASHSAPAHGDSRAGGNGGRGNDKDHK
jgi:hypothetical protein